jgi:hypothetical protein
MMGSQYSGKTKPERDYPTEAEVPEGWLSAVEGVQHVADTRADSPSGRPFDPKALSRMLDAVADSSVSDTLVS